MPLRADPRYLALLMPARLAQAIILIIMTLGTLAMACLFVLYFIHVIVSARRSRSRRKERSADA
jgi:hypothetical protein